MSNKIWATCFAIFVGITVFVFVFKGNHSTRLPAGDIEKAIGELFTEDSRKQVDDTLKIINDKLLGNKEEGIKEVETQADLIKVIKDIIKRDKDTNTPADRKSGVIKNKTLRLHAIIARAIYDGDTKNGHSLAGAIYRLRTVTEPIMPAYIAAIQGLRNIKYDIHHSPKFINALFGFVTQPNPKATILEQKGPFKTVPILQTFLVKKLAAQIKIAIKDLNELIATCEPNEGISLAKIELMVGRDKAEKNQNERGQKHFGDKIVITAHLKGAVGFLHNVLGFIYYTSSFHLEGLEKFVNILTANTVKAAAKRWLIASETGAPSDLVSTPKELKDVLNLTRTNSGNGPISWLKNAFTSKKELKARKNFLKFNGKVKYLKEAQKHFLLAAKDDQDYLEYLNLAPYPSDDSFIISHDHLQDHYKDFSAAAKHRVELLDCGISGYEANMVKLEDLYSNDYFTVDVCRLFNPKVVKDLGAYFPTNFSTKPGQILGGNDWDNFSWNYMYGQPTMWNDKLKNLIGVSKDEEVRERIAQIQRHPSTPLLGLFLIFSR